MTTYYIDEFINNINNQEILIDLNMINNIQTFYNINNATEKSNDILIILQNESNAYNKINEIYLFLQSLNNYNPDSTSENIIIDESLFDIIDSTSNTDDIKGVKISSIINFIKDTNDINLLKSKIQENNLLSSQYKLLIETSIDKIIEIKKKLILTSSNNIFDFLTTNSIVPFFSIKNDNNSDFKLLTEMDKKFFVFLNHILYVGLNHSLNNSDSQLLLKRHSVDNQIFLESINYALNETYVYTISFYNLLSYINDIFQYSIPYLLDYKDKILLNGYPIYWITYSTIIRLFLDKGNVLEKIATIKVDDNNIFYTSTDFNSSVLFN